MRYVTSISIVPPLEVQAIALPILREFAYDFPRRLPAHITVLYPFVPPPALDEGTAVLRALCAEIAPFEVTLAGYGKFTGVTYMQPQPNPALDSLLQRVSAAFPQCNPYDGMFNGLPAAHLTVAIFSSARKQNLAQLPPYPPQTFTVDRLHVSMGVEQRTVNWIVRDVVRLGG